MARSVRSSDARATPLFLCSPGDEEEIAACRAAAWTCVVEWEPSRGDYARKMNHGYELARSHGFEWAFLAADDLAFYGGWFDAGLRAHEQTSACVVGTNDLGNSRVVAGRHSTHTLVHRDYLDCGGTVDEPGVLLHAGYWHNFVDDEFVQTAVARGSFVSAPDAHVEHLHPNWRKGKDDATYRRGMEHFDDDRRLHAARSRLWAPARPGRRRG